MKTTTKIENPTYEVKLGLDKTYLCRIESGKQNVTIETLQIICNGLGISLKEFFSVFTDSN